MRSIFLSVISLLCLVCCTATAQKKYVYEERTVSSPQSEMVVDTVVSNIDDDFDDDIRVVEAPMADDEADANKQLDVVRARRDTSLYARYASVPIDSVHLLKNSEKLAYLQRLDSLLQAKRQQDEPVEEEGNGRKWWDGDWSFLNPMLWVLGIAFVGFILYSLFLKDGVFRRNSKTLQSVSEVPQEEVKPGADMDRLIRQALQQRNYRLAIRYQYLNCLYKLADKGLVQFAADKTNYQYVSELTNAPLRNSFAELTLHYEYVWYGEFDIDESVYQKIEPGFTAFFNKI